MLGKKKGYSEKVDQAVSKSVSYEITVAELALRSQRRAWMVAGCSLAMSLILAGGYFYMLPLKEKVPYMVMADAYTGTATVARLQGDFENQQITSREAINRSSVAQYVLAKESYDSEIMSLRDWNLVFIMSSPAVGSGHRQIYAENNPANPFIMYGKNRAIRVKILSITPLAQSQNGGFRGAAVRVQRSLYEKVNGTSKFLDNRLVTMAFEYDPNLKLSEQDRLQNPLGFRVTEYRVDNDYSVPAPTLPEAPAPESVAAPEASLPPQTAPVSPDAAESAPPPLQVAAPEAGGMTTGNVDKGGVPVR